MAINEWPGEPSAADLRNELYYDTGVHKYLSTACLHGEHSYCQSTTGQQGKKTPATCKFCNAPCICECHTTAS